MGECLRESDTLLWVTTYNNYSRSPASSRSSSSSSSSTAAVAASMLVNNRFCSQVTRDAKWNTLCLTDVLESSFSLDIHRLVHMLICVYISALSCRIKSKFKVNQRDQRSSLHGISLSDTFESFWQTSVSCHVCDHRKQLFLFSDAPGVNESDITKIYLVPHNHPIYIRY